MLSYVALIGVVLQAGRFQTAMFWHEAQMVRYATQATLLQGEAAADESQSTADSNLAVQDNTESLAWKERGAALEVKAQEEQAAAAHESALASSLDAKAATEQNLANTDLTKAAAEEVIVQQDTVAAGQATASAAELETDVASETAGVAICEAIPFLDVVCNAVGGVLGAATQASAGAETSLAVSDAASAAAEQKTQVATTAQASQAEAAAASDTASGASYQSNAARDEATAVSYQDQALKDMATSQTLHAAAQEEDILAAEKVTAAEADTAEADACMQKVLQNGLEAITDLVLSVLLAVAAICCCATKIILRSFGVAPSVAMAMLSCSQGGSSAKQVLQSLAYGSLHIWILVCTALSLLSFAKTASLGNNVELFLATPPCAAFIQCLCFHVLPSALQTNCRFLLRCLELIAFLVVLFTMEELGFLVVVGHVAGEQVPFAACWSAWLLFVAAAAAYLWFTKVDGEAPQNERRSQKDEEVPHERSGLLLGAKELVFESRSPDRPPNHISFSWSSLLLPLEMMLLIYSFRVSFFCLKHTVLLRPLLGQWIKQFV